MHLEGCESEDIICTRDNCSEKLTRSKFRKHVDTECQWRKVACYYCQVEVIVCMHQVSAVISVSVNIKFSN